MGREGRGGTEMRGLEKGPRGSACRRELQGRLGHSVSVQAVHCTTKETTRQGQVWGATGVPRQVGGQPARLLSARSFLGSTWRPRPFVHLSSRCLESHKDLLEVIRLARCTAKTQPHGGDLHPGSESFSPDHVGQKVAVRQGPRGWRQPERSLKGGALNP